MSLLVKKTSAGVLVRLGKPLSYHLPETANNLRKDPPEFLLENIKTCKDMKSEGLIEFIESRLKDNSIVLLKECVNTHCVLNRVLSGGTRTAFQTHLVKMMTSKFAVLKAPLVYTIFHYQHLLQDLLILDEFLQKCPDVNVEINIIMNSAYTDAIFDPKCNSETGRVTPSKLTGDMVILISYQLISFLDWFAHYHKKQISLRLFQDSDSLINSGLKSDVFVGVDYINNVFGHKFVFMTTSMICTKQGGIIASLRTDGLSEFLTNRNIHFEIFENVDSNMIQLYKDFETALGVVGPDEDDEIYLDLITFREGPKYIHMADPSALVVERNGKEYRFRGFCVENRKGIYRVRDYDNKVQALVECREKFGADIEKIYTDVSKIYDLDGLFRIGFWLTIYKWLY